jgi:hypothetical protein
MGLAWAEQLLICLQVNDIALVGDDTLVSASSDTTIKVSMPPGGLGQPPMLGPALAGPR